MLSYACTCVQVYCLTKFTHTLSVYACHIHAHYSQPTSSTTSSAQQTQHSTSHKLDRWQCSTMHPTTTVASHKASSRLSLCTHQCSSSTYSTHSSSPLGVLLHRAAAVTCHHGTRLCLLTPLHHSSEHGSVSRATQLTTLATLIRSTHRYAQSLDIVVLCSVVCAHQQC
jgi:3-polyprenyl-4-hydroxybenzoate decarboxylase